MTKADLLIELRDEIDDTKSQKYRYRTSRLISLLSEGQDKFCEETGFFLDATSYSIVTEAGRLHYPISDRIIQVKDVFIGTTKLTHFQEFERPMQSISGVENTTPVHWQADHASHTLTFYEPPVAGLNAALRVWRYPTNVLSVSSGEPEIPAQFRRALVEYAAAKVLGDHDGEKYDPVRAAVHRDEYNRYVSEGAKAFRRITAKHTKVAPSPLYSFT